MRSKRSSDSGKSTKLAQSTKHASFSKSAKSSRLAQDLRQGKGKRASRRPLRPTVNPEARRVCDDGKGLSIEVESLEPARLRVLSDGIDLESFYVYLDAFVLEGASPPVTFQEPTTNMMSEFVNKTDERVFEAGVFDELLIHPDIMTFEERRQLLQGVGCIATARLCFRRGGDSPALVEGRDYELLREHRFLCRAVVLCEADW